MDDRALGVLFDRYIARFDTLTNSYYDETYKWAACQQFQDCWEPAAADFHKMLKNALGGLGNLTDARTSPRRGIVKFAEQEPEAVREMFLALFTDGELEARIDCFVRDSERLQARLGYQSSYRYRQTSPAVLAYLTCWRPDEYFFYKHRETVAFARAVGFEDSWGSGASFKPAVYFRMCSQLIEAMRRCDDLLAVNARRFDTERRLWPDKALHILAYDVIYCSFSKKYGTGE